MPTTAQLRTRLVGKLKELFQLDQPDLDFGFYRIMHAKAKQVTEFLEKDLLQVIEDTFGNQADQNSAAALTNARRELEEALGSDALDENGLLKESFGALPAGKRYLEALAKAAAAKDALSAEGEIYDHLHRFFERYYEDGDFISRRYFSRETAGRAAPFAIPYNGEEVKLHWANADQYYIKTGEYFSNFTIDLTKAPEMVGKEDELGLENRDQPLLVHFRLVDASEGEHGNVKASEATKRFFLLHDADPVGLNEKGELELRFKYRPDPDKPGRSQDGAWKEQRRSEAVTKLLSALATLSDASAYYRLLSAKSPTEANRDRTLLAKYLLQYTEENTADYFIHKDLGGFLHRDLDFYIKNEVMRLDDIEEDSAPRVETYLAKLKVLRTIARQIIAFLAQLEDFQKKLWLKKKFVVETNYGITLDRIPETLYPEITANDAQREEWVNLYSIDEIEGEASGDLLQGTTAGYSCPLTTEFLKFQPHLVLDTRHFSGDFKARLVASIEDFDKQCDGLLVHSDNFQALNLLSLALKSSVSCIYIDPPYNTDGSPINYKNGFKSSTWITLFQQSLPIAKTILSNDAVLCAAIDDEQTTELLYSAKSIFNDNFLGTIVVRSNPSGRPKQTGYSVSHEYLHFFGKSGLSRISRMPPTEDQAARFNERDDKGPFEWRNLRREGSGAERSDRPKLFFPIYLTMNSVRVPEMTWNEVSQEWIVTEEPKSGEVVALPIAEDGTEKRWRWGQEKITSSSADLCARNNREGNLYPYAKRRPNEEGVVSISSWFDAKYSATEHGTAVVKNLFGDNAFSFPKSIHAVRDSIYVSGAGAAESLILDYFGGSGTTAHAVISLNREYGGSRRYSLIEMGDHFNTVLKPRIAKVVYSSDWKDGKPTARSKGISHCFKYIRLESYEDSLNNLSFSDNTERERVLAANESLRRDYTLNYLLDVETRGSQSLLNITDFTDPTAYKLKVKKPGTTVSVEQNVDLIETFNFLIGLRLVHLAAPQRFSAKFKRVPDPDLPKGTDTRLQLDGKMKQSADGAWWFRKVEGWVPKDRENPNNGQKEKVLIVWRTLTGNLEEDNLMLDEWFQKNRLSTRDFEFDTIYVNGSNNLPNLKLDSDTWKVRLLEEEFHKAMWDVQDV
jgi:adenine-specific DNA-methyltransferase